MQVEMLKCLVAFICTCAIAFIPTSFLPYVPFKRQSVQSFLVALTVGALLADVFLLMLPHLLHLHHEHHEEHPPPPPEPMKKKGLLERIFAKKEDPVFAVLDSEHHDEDSPHLMLVLLGFLVFFFLERFFQSFEEDEKKIKDSVFEGKPKEEDISSSDKKDKASEGLKFRGNDKDADKKTDIKGKKAPEQSDHSVNDHDDSDHDHHDHHHSLNPACKITLSMDVLHNLSDGLRLGVAFFTSMAGGLGLSVIYLVHEMVHELGDTTTLVQNGQSPIHAIHFQHKTATALFLGCAVGMTSERYVKGADYLMAIGAGSYLYVGLVKMLPQLLAKKNADLLHGIIESCAILLGFFTMKYIFELESNCLVPLINYAEYLIDSFFAPSP